MPMIRALYPKDWEKIAAKVKEQAGYRCQQCDRPCRRPRESWPDFCLRISEQGEINWYLQTYDEVHDDETGEWGSVERPQRFTLTVAHLDHNPANCDLANLRALCSGCHLRYDAPMKAARKRAKSQAKSGQLSFL